MSLIFDDSVDREAIKSMTTKRLNRYLNAGSVVTVTIDGKSLTYTVKTGESLHLRVIANIKKV